MKKYLNPEFEICAVSEADVLRTSGEVAENILNISEIKNVQSYGLDDDIWHR